jgi:anti-sigma factor RsiW
MQHITDGAIDGYVLGTLSPLRVKEVEEHLLVCETCQERLDGTSDFVQSISAAVLELRQMKAPFTLRVGSGSS